MDDRDQELLDKQMRGLNLPSRNDGVVMLAIVAVFFTGLAFGGFVAERQAQPTQIASDDSGALPSLSHGARILR